MRSVKSLNSEIKLLEHLQITHNTIATTEETRTNDADIDGKIEANIGGANMFNVHSDRLNFFDSLEVVKSSITGGEIIRFNIANAGDTIRLGVNNLSRLDATNVGVGMYGDVTCAGNSSFFMAV